MNTTDLLQLHDDTSKKCREIMRAKNSDYTGGEGATDALANFKCATALGLHPVTGLLLRVQDKLMRIRSFVSDGKLRVSGESVEDACDDIVNYAILAKALLREESARPNPIPESDSWITEHRPHIADTNINGEVEVPDVVMSGVACMRDYRLVEAGEPWRPAAR